MDSVESYFSAFVSDAAELDAINNAIWNDAIITSIEQWPERRSVEKVKRQVRRGVVHRKRRKLWLTVTGGAAFLEKQPQFYVDTVRAMYGAVVPTSFHIPGQLTPCCTLQYFWLTSDGQQIVHKILNVLAHLRPDVQSCPLLAPIVVILLHFMNESECFACAIGLLDSKRQMYFEHTHKGAAANQRSLTDVARSRASPNFKFVVRVVSERFEQRVDRRDETMYQQLKGWQTWLFGFLPFPQLVRVCDCFFVEGFKVLFRVGVAILKHFHMAHKHQGVTGDLDSAVCEFVRHHHDDLLMSGFKIRRVSRHLLDRYRERNISASQSLGEVADHDVESFIVVPQADKQSTIVMESSQWHTLWSWIPSRFEVCKPIRLFLSNDDGYNLTTLYRKCAHHEPLLLFVKTTEGEIIGAYLSSSLEGRFPKFKYFGTGETFIFSLAPEAKRYCWTGEADVTAYFIAGDDTCLAVGGGGSSYGLWLDRELNRGVAGPSTTFANPPLIPPAKPADNSFAISSVEIYAFADH